MSAIASGCVSTGSNVGEVTFANRGYRVRRFAIAQATPRRGRQHHQSGRARWRNGLQSSRLRSAHLPPASTGHEPTRSRSARTPVNGSPSRASAPPGSASSTSPVTSRLTKCLARVTRDGAGWKVTLTVPGTGRAHADCRRARCRRKPGERASERPRRPCTRPARRAKSS